MASASPTLGGSNQRMQALRLHPDRSLRVDTVDVPELRLSSVVVKVLAGQIPGYAKAVTSGALGYTLPDLPSTLGLGPIGIVEQVASDVFDVHVGQLVFVDFQIRSRTIGAEDNILIGWSSIGSGGEKVMGVWKDGSFAQKALCPSECVTVIPQPDLATPAQWSIINWLAISYGALLKGGVSPGCSLIVNGGSGSLGSLAAQIALAMGAAKVVITGRKADALQLVCALDSRRIKSASVAGSQAEAEQAISAALGGKLADVAVDLAGMASTADSMQACLSSIKPNGVLVIAGSMTCAMPLDTRPVRRRELQIRGAFMYPREAPGALIAMVEAGTLDLNGYTIHTFPLAQHEQALTKAEGLPPFSFSVIEPNA